ncbi:MAG: hypothetical protein ABR537_03750 [Gemmatimonadales bacterium]
MRFTTTLMTTAAALALATAPMARPVYAAPVRTAAITTSVLTVPFTTHAFVAAVQDAKIEVNTDTHSRRAWYTNPVWIAIGIIALVLVIALIAMAGRGRDTTVIK